MPYPKSTPQIACGYLTDNICLVATKLGGIPTRPTASQCHACLSSPQRINGVTCGLARDAQDRAGLQVDQTLTKCVFDDAMPVNPELIAEAHKCWETIHTFDLRVWLPEAARAFYSYWLTTIPDFDCGCVEHWKEITELYPILFDTHRNFFISVWYAHNILNEELFKPWVLLKDAKKTWGVNTWVKN